MVLFEGLTTTQKVSVHASVAGTYSGITHNYNKDQVDDVCINEMVRYWYATHHEKFKELPIIKQDIYTKFIDMKSKHLKRLIEKG